MAVLPELRSEDGRMNVIVKGMKMPDCCVECELNDSDDDGIYCTALEVFMCFDELPKGRRTDCPLAELIRCKDCKYYEPDLFANPWGVCFHWEWIVNDTGHTVDENGYCYRAERKEE